MLAAVQLPRFSSIMAVISGPGFNTIPGSDVLWTIAAEDNGLVHPHMLMNRARPELQATPMQITPEGIRRNVDGILHGVLDIR
jgi:hypothetical protein